MTEMIEESGQFLAFAVNGSEYGVPIMMVREINGWTPATRLPNQPGFMRGVINLRGLIVPIFDLHARFTGQLTAAEKNHVVIVLAVGERNLGILVDAVSDILTVPMRDIRPAPSEATEPGHDYVSGLLMVEERIVALLDITHLFDLSLIDAATTEVA